MFFLLLSESIKWLEKVSFEHLLFENNKNLVISNFSNNFWRIICLFNFYRVRDHLAKYSATLPWTVGWWCCRGSLCKCSKNAYAAWFLAKFPHNILPLDVCRSRCSRRNQESSSHCRNLPPTRNLPPPHNPSSNPIVHHRLLKMVKVFVLPIFLHP